MAMRDFFVPERPAPRLSDCYFYHTVELPGGGVMEGEWDFRSNFAAYFGGVDFSGKRVFEIGTASGGLCFELERQGAEVVGFDLSPEQSWDLVPFPGPTTVERSAAERKAHIGRINNAWWFARNAVNGRANLVHGTVYQMPSVEREFDIVTMGSILLHLRDPLLAMTNASLVCRDTLIVTDCAVDPAKRARMGNDCMWFLPDPDTQQPYETWWLFTEEFVVRMLRILGFSQFRTTRHTQQSRHGPLELFTVVARR